MTLQVFTVHTKKKMTQKEILDVMDFVIGKLDLRLETMGSRTLTKEQEEMFWMFYNTALGDKK